MAPLVSGGRTQPMDADCSTLAMPSKLLLVDGATSGPGVDWSTGSRVTGPRGIREGGIRRKRLAVNLGPAAGGSAGMSRSAGDVSWAVDRETSGCAAGGDARAPVAGRIENAAMRATAGMRDAMLPSSSRAERLST